MKSPYSNFVVIDIESGGLPNATKRAVYNIALTEVAFVVVSANLEVVEEKSWLIKPYKEDLIYDKGAEIASGISRAMVEKDGMDIQTAVAEQKAILKKYKDGSALPVVLGHNFVKFDSEFMINSFEFCKEDILKYVNSEPEDTLKWSRLRWPESNNYKLGTCCENAGITLIDAHRALNDTRVTAQLWIHFMKNLRGENTKQLEPTKRFRANFEL